MTRARSVSIETKLRFGRPWFNSRQEQWCDFSLRHCIQIISGAYGTFYSRGTGGKAAGTWSWTSPPSNSELKNAWSYASTPRLIKKEIRPHGVVLSQAQGQLYLYLKRCLMVSKKHCRIFSSKHALVITPFVCPNGPPVM